VSTQAFSHIFWRLIALQGLASWTYGVPTVRDSTTARHGTTLGKDSSGKSSIAICFREHGRQRQLSWNRAFFSQQTNRGTNTKKENAWRKQLETIKNTAPDLHPQLKESAFSLSPLPTDTLTPSPPPAPTVDAQHSSRTLLLRQSKGSREKSSTTHEKMGTTKR